MTDARWQLHTERFLGPDSMQRKVAGALYERAAELPIISPHGHVDPRLFAERDASFGTPAEMFIIPDHYIFRMRLSQGERHRLRPSDKAHWHSRPRTAGCIESVLF